MDNKVSLVVMMSHICLEKMDMESGKRNTNTQESILMMTRCKLLLVSQSRVELPRNFAHTSTKKMKNQDMVDIMEEVRDITEKVEDTTVKMEETDIMESHMDAMVAHSSI